MSTGTTIDAASPALRKLLDRLKGVRQNGHGFLAYCPAHLDKKKRSLSINERYGKILLHCFTGCALIR
jgi:hypothetical protein